MPTSMRKENVLSKVQEKPCENPDQKEPQQPSNSNNQQKQPKKRSLHDLLKNVGDCV